MRYEDRIVPAQFSVVLFPGAGFNGDTAATISGSLSLDSSLPSDGNGGVLVEATSQQVAISRAIVGTIMVTLAGQTYYYSMAPGSVGASPSEQRFFLYTGSGSLQFEDMAGTGTSDWDYNDHYWMLNVSPVNGGSPPSPQVPPSPTPGNTSVSAVWLTAGTNSTTQIDGGFTIHRSSGAGTLTVYYGAPGGTATAGVDYTGLTPGGGSVTFAEDQTEFELYLQAFADDDLDETVTLALAASPTADYTFDTSVPATSIYIDDFIADTDLEEGPTRVLPPTSSSASLGSISGIVWNDGINPDGHQNEDEPGIAGQWVFLTSYNGIPIASVQTSASGVYTFTGLADGEYSVEWVSDVLTENITASVTTSPPTVPPSPIDPPAPSQPAPAPPPAAGPAQPADSNGLYVSAGDRVWWEAAAGGADKITWKRVEIDGVERYQLTVDRAGATFEKIVAALRTIGISDEAVLGTIMNRIYGDLASPQGRPNAPFFFELQFSNATQPYTMADIAPASIGKTLDTELDAKFQILKDKLTRLFEQGGPIKVEDVPTFLKGVVRGFFDDGFVGDIEGIGSLLEGAWKVSQVQSKVIATVLIAGGKTLVEQASNWRRFTVGGLWESATGNLESTANTVLSSEIAFASDSFKKVVEAHKALTGAQAEVLLEIARYFEAQAKGQPFTPSDKAQRALKIVGLIAVDLGITALDAATPENLGRLYGWIAYQVVQTVVLDVVTAGAAEALRAGKLAAGLTGATERLATLGLDIGKITRLFERLKSLGQSAAVLTDVERTAQLARATETARAIEALKAGRRAPLMVVEGQLAGGCFAPGTMLLTPTGYKAVEDFRAGDAILTREQSNPDAPVEAGVVAQTFRRYAGLMSVSVEGRWLRLTAEHPFWIAQGWVEAHTLRVGDRVLGADGRWLAIEGIRDAVGHEVVYNLEVRYAHTFFVGAENWGFAVWVHNLTPEQCAKLKLLTDFKAQRELTAAEKLEFDGLVTLGAEQKAASTRGMNGRILSVAEQAEFAGFGRRAQRLGFIESPFRTGSWGRMEGNTYHEVTRIDVAEVGKPGWRGQTHIHIEGNPSHLDPLTPLPGE